MSIASELNNLEGNIEDSYDAVNDMGGIIPAQRNMDNLDQAIRTIPQSQGTTYTAGTGIDITNDVISIDNTVVPEFSDLATVATTGDYGDLLNTPTVPTDTSDLTNDGDDGVHPFLATDDVATVATSGDYTDLINTPTIPTNTSDLTNDGDDGVHPFLATDDVATVATSGLYSDLTGTPTIPTNTSDLVNDGSDGTSTYVEADDLATVATSGLYSDLTGTPTIPAAQIQSDWTQATTTALDYIKNKPEIRHVNSVSDAGWSADANKLVDGSVLAYWNGAYSGTTSNLQYFKDNSIGCNHFNEWSTANTADTWVPVGNGNKIQHRVIKAFNSDGSIPASALASNAVETAKIKDGAVTSAKLNVYSSGVCKLGNFAMWYFSFSNSTSGWVTKDFSVPSGFGGKIVHATASGLWGNSADNRLGAWLNWNSNTQLRLRIYQGAAGSNAWSVVAFAVL